MPCECALKFMCLNIVELFIYFFFMFNLCFHGETCRTQPVGLRLLQPQTPSAVASGSRPKGFVDKPGKLHAVP